MKVITKNRKAVREALAQEGWRFSLVSSVEELQRHHTACRTLTLPAGYESDSRLRSRVDLAHFDRELRSALRLWNAINRNLQTRKEPTK